MPRTKEIQLELVRQILRGVEQPFQDSRRKLNVVVCDYLGSDGYEYRKAFCSYGEPIIPVSGSNSSITALQKQW